MRRRLVVVGVFIASSILSDFESMKLMTTTIRIIKRIIIKEKKFIIVIILFHIIEQFIGKKNQN